ncbi:extracellular solute-binding protein [Varunaivibrio sulfuroxidans]|uniref:Spermidine/putrescine transport system substrate-binding protein n=1 Tax=Varunaivibrio sulfuroxidans TaxID=1773489 RepID=A0A4R3JDF1_9PROT|nr:extracellular solute-binding protein [Varunaivibrio sulfuroxidans]TCS63435.1 spermidine/putrescine transport system substrate-binding protein [Varunaivibrio sulfuroxidans]WES30419.1 extracellular solute-binding protein [Varunaivibrio sulfuroxidans]
MLNRTKMIAGLIAGVGIALSAGGAQAETLRLLTWGGYAPEKVVQMFKAETGIDVQVTNSNNEEMISKLRATGGAGFDLVQPSQDRISGAQGDFNIYKPIDLSKIDTSLFIPSLLEGTKKNTTYNGKVYGVPDVWGTSALTVNVKKAPDVKDYTDLCDPKYAGKVSYRLKRPTLIAFAFAMGMDPFAAYNDSSKYKVIMEKVEKKLISCKSNVKAYWSGGDALLNLMRSGEVVAAMAWDGSGWKLSAENPDIQTIAPKSGALGWVDTFALPRKTKNESAAYKWINFVMQPKIAAMVTAAAGNFTASKGSDAYVEASKRALYQKTFPPAAIDNIKWYPPVPSGLEDMEGKVLDHVKAAK